ncbi:hypothetical protein FB45DRAFT_1050984 [Roridomyces roridus]|uniref:F-box domain-containing protein n=1 Tax=Roridomyces roridus TaxID=1738132 RepID=A0AAD7CNA7_9AGAR|nr:hypothetical protein FB45DRAFT_1050984 [Roridomyces roridus]
MDGLPNELLDRICSFMHTTELCTTMHISSSLRRVASAHLLFQLGISQADVRAGTVTLALSKSLHLILFVAHICPIQRLECFANSKNMRAFEFRRLAPILGATAPIPDILIHDKLEHSQREHGRSLVLHLLAHLPQAATDTLLIITRFSIHVSRHCFGPPPLLAFPGLRQISFAWLLVCLLIDIQILILCAVFNLCSLIWWLFRRSVGPRWSVEDRISADVSNSNWFHFSGGIRVQSLPTNYTLVTPIFRESGFVIEPLHGVPDSVYLTCLASPDFQFKDIKVQLNSHMTFADLVAFVACQEELACSTNSIARSFSLLSASPPHISSKITRLTGPASYSPHLLPLTPHVERIYLSFPSLAIRLQVIYMIYIFSIGPRVFDYVAYCTTLNAIARLPGSHPLALSFIFDLTEANIPWQMDATDAPQPESQLYRVEHLMLRTTESARQTDIYYDIPSRTPLRHAYAAFTIRALATWLARVSRACGACRSTRALLRPCMMSQSQRLEVVEAIAGSCGGLSGAGDVRFQIRREERMGSALW